jgi:hypothetical protein
MVAPAGAGMGIALRCATFLWKGHAMQFRWIAILTLWTMLVGPMLDAPLGTPKAGPQATKVRSK